MKRGWLEPNCYSDGCKRYFHSSYSDRYKHNGNSKGVIPKCIYKTIHYFLKLGELYQSVFIRPFTIS